VKIRVLHGVMSMSSHAGNGAAEATWLWCDVDAESYWRRCCGVMLVMVLSRRLSRSAMSMSSHASDGAAEATWPWHNIIVKSCRR
jgi:hypothetical protein